MTNVRAICAMVLFLMAMFTLLDLWVTGFSFFALILSMVLFLAAYWLWPSKRDDPRHRYQENRWFDWLEFLVELPVEVLLWLVRSLLGFLRRGADDIDILS